jgi:hypothetical protein
MLEGGSEAGRSRFERREARSKWQLSRAVLAISRISFILYLIPMGKEGLRGGRPEASGASLGRTISKIFALLYLFP